MQPVRGDVMAKRRAVVRSCSRQGDLKDVGRHQPAVEPTQPRAHGELLRERRPRRDRRARRRRAHGRERAVGCDAVLHEGARRVLLLPARAGAEALEQVAWVDEVLIDVGEDEPLVSS